MNLSEVTCPHGQHLLADFHGVPASKLADPVLIETALRQAAVAAGATPIHGHFHHFGEGQGVTGVLLLQESHISIHTWPEDNFAAIDVFMCGAAQPRQALITLQQLLAPSNCWITDHRRGRLPVEPHLT
ncbi:adenosylmethionine decarboxylase [Chitinivorax sp. B]|uniref:adenosylmethionine decarboxylase n=1 Tax=Chitinivorax sp. B TaxID=2502235 RepID=UPI0010F47BBC|nr:adenosylmethionine decarboxylase [Chitinivorax sp. B]